MGGDAMRWVFAAVARRGRAAVLAGAGGGGEGRVGVRAAARKAVLLRAAERHERSGRGEVAAELRRQAGELSGDRPLAAVRAAVADLAAGLSAGDMPPAPQPGVVEPSALPRRGRRR